MSKKTNRIKKRVAEAQSGAAVRVHPLVRRSVRAWQKETAQALNTALRPRRTDTERLDWLQRTTCSIGYNVECSAWGVDFEAPYARTIREAIDAAMDIA